MSEGTGANDIDPYSPWPRSPTPFLDLFERAKNYPTVATMLATSALTPANVQFRRWTNKPDTELNWFTSLTLSADRKKAFQQSLDMLSKDPEGKSLVTRLNKSLIQVTGAMWDNEAGGEAGGLYNPASFKNGRLTTFSTSVDINPRVQGLDELTNLFAHELTHVRQQASGTDNPFQGKIPPPEEAMVHNNVIEADAQATATEISYRLMRQGETGPWNALKTGGWKGRIAEAYEQAVSKDPAALDSGYAKRAAFDAWFENTPKSYITQGLLSYPSSVTIAALRAGGAEPAHLAEEDYQAIGTAGDRNYLALPGSRPLTDYFYSKKRYEPKDVAILEGLKARLPLSLAGVDIADPAGIFEPYAGKADIPGDLLRRPTNLDTVSGQMMRQWSEEALYQTVSEPSAADKTRLEGLAARAIDADPEVFLSRLGTLAKTNNAFSGTTAAAAPQWAERAFSTLLQQGKEEEAIKASADLGKGFERGDPLFATAQQALQKGTSALKASPGLLADDAARLTLGITKTLEPGNAFRPVAVEALSTALDDMKASQPHRASEFLGRLNFEGYGLKTGDPHFDLTQGLFAKYAAELSGRCPQEVMLQTGRIAADMKDGDPRQPAVLKAFSDSLDAARAIYPAGVSDINSTLGSPDPASALGRLLTEKLATPSRPLAEIQAAAATEDDAYGRQRAAAGEAAITAPSSRFAGAQSHAGTAVGAAAVAVELAEGHYGRAVASASQQAALSSQLWEASARLAEEIAPLAKALGAVSKRIPVIGAAVTAGYVLYEAGGDLADGKTGKAGGAEALGNTVGFGVGDVAREAVRGIVIREAGEDYAVQKSGIRTLVEKAIEVSTRLTESRAPPTAVAVPSSAVPAGTPSPRKIQA